MLLYSNFYGLLFSQTCQAREIKGTRKNGFYSNSASVPSVIMTFSRIMEISFSMLNFNFIQCGWDILAVVYGVSHSSYFLQIQCSSGTAYRLLTEWWQWCLYSTATVRTVLARDKQSLEFTITQKFYENFSHWFCQGRKKILSLTFIFANLIFACLIKDQIGEVSTKNFVSENSLYSLFVADAAF